MPKEAQAESRARAARGLRLLVGLALASLAGGGASLAGCGATATSGKLGSETHFLSSCVSECAGGLTCIAGLCTLPCGGDAECSTLDAAATCRYSASTQPDSCQVECATDRECTGRNADWSCSAGRCRASAVSDLPRLGAASSGADCNQNPLWAPTDVTTSFEAVPGSDGVVSAVADEQGVYWADHAGAIFGLTRGSSTPDVLRPGTPGPVLVTRMLTDPSRVYWAEVDDPPRDPGELGESLPAPEFPARLLAAPKSGGQAEILLQLLDQPVDPLSASSAGVIVSTGDALAYVEDGGMLRPIPNIPAAPGGELQVADGRAYWSTPIGDTAGRELFTAPLDGGSPQYLGRIEGDFLLGDGVVLWKQLDVSAGPLRLVQTFFRLELGSGCVYMLSNMGAGIDSELIDQRHVYWRSYDAFSMVTAADPLPAEPFVRVNLETNAIQRLLSPGLDINLTTQFLAQDELRIYLRVGDAGSLLALRKPD